jgi:hypothetical protein
VYQEADITKMIQDAARLLVEQQQNNAPRGTLHSLGRKFNKAMKLVLAVPSDPELKTYSKTNPELSYKQMMMPFGTTPMTSFGLHGRVPNTLNARSRPPTTATHHTRDNGKQSGESSRYPNAPRILDRGERFDAEGGGRANAAYIDTQDRPQARANTFRESDATLWDTRQPYDPRSPGFKSGHAPSVFSEEGTLLPTQRQAGNPKYQESSTGGYPSLKKASAASLRTPRQLATNDPRTPSPKYNPSVKSHETTAIPTQSQIYEFEK